MFKKRKPQLPIRNPEASEFEIDNELVGRFILEKLVPIIGLNPFPLNEQMLLVGAVCRFQPTHLIEWGTHIGVSARVFYETIMYFGLKTKIYSIDLPDEVVHVEHPKSERGRLVKDFKGVELIQGDGLEEALRIGDKLTAKSRTLFFVDGDHAYSTVKREGDALMRRFPYAPIIFHDTFYQSASSGLYTGPHRAVQDLLKKRGQRYKAVSTATGAPGMTLVYPRKTIGR